MKSKTASKAIKRKRRMTRAECCMAWAIALGLVMAPAPIVYPSFADEDTQEEAAPDYEGTGGTVYVYSTDTDNPAVYANVYGIKTTGSTASDSSPNYVYINAYEDSEGNITAGTGTVTVQGSVYGGYTTSGAAQYNYVYLYDGSIVGETTTSETSSDGSTTTTVTVDGGGSVYGGYSTSGAAQYNSVYLYEGSILVDSVYGGYTAGSSKDAAENEVYLYDGSIAASVYGGYASGSYGDAAANYVYLYDGSSVGDSVYGGYASGSSGEASYNYVYLYNGSIVGTETATSETDSSGNVTSTTVTVESGSVYGGYATKGTAQYNEVYVNIADEESNDGTTASTTEETDSDSAAAVAEESVIGTIYGGYSESGKAQYNYVYLYGSIVGTETEQTDSSGNVTVTVEGGSVYGGYSGASNAQYNKVYAYDGSSAGTIYGGYTAASSKYAQNNKVYVYGTASVIGTIYGGYSENYGAKNDYVYIEGAAVDTVYGDYSAGSSTSSAYSYNSTVEINGGTVGTVYGGYSVNSKVYSASVTITGGTIDDVYGGFSTSSKTTSTVYENTVDISSSEVSGAVYGGQAIGGLEDNSVEITNSTIGTDSESEDNAAFDAVIGAYSTDNTAFDNSVAISSSTVYGSVYGAKTDSYNYSNTVSISEDSYIDGDVYGGYAADTGKQESYNNGVSIDGSKVTGSVYGSYVLDGDVFFESASSYNTAAAITDSTIGGSVYGNYAADGSASGASYRSSGVYDVIISGSASITGGVYGGCSSSYASYNSVLIGEEDTDSTLVIAGSVYGGYSTDSYATVNSVVINSGSIKGNVYGNYSVKAAAYGYYTMNDEEIEVSVTDVTITGGIVGTKTEETDSDGNTTVTVQGGDVYGGYGGTDVHDNDVVISGGEIAGDVYGGYTSSDSDSYINSVVISSETGEDGTYTTVIGGSVYGNYSVSGTATDSYTDRELSSAVVISGGTIKGEVYGNYSESGYAVGTGTTDTPDVLISGGTFGGYVYGGYSESGTAEYNSVSAGSSSADLSSVTIIGGGTGTGIARDNAILVDGFTAGYVYGGYSAESGTVIENTVTVTSGSAIDVWGGYSNSGTAAANTVVISQDTDDATTITGNVYGNYTVSGTAKSSYLEAYTSVVISGGTLGVETTDDDGDAIIVGGEVYGNYSVETSVTGTGTMDTPNVLISGGAIYNNVYGGYSGGGSAEENYVYISGGVIGTEDVIGVGNVYGGYSEGGDASYNAVTVTDEAKLDEHVYGGYTTTGDAEGNVVEVSGSAVIGINTASSGYTGDTYGGYSESGEASENYVYISDEAEVDGDVHGGHGATEVTGNIVTASGSSNVTGEVYGGHTYTADAVVSENGVILTDSSTVSWAVGGYSSAASTVTENYVTIEDDAYALFVYGGLSNEGVTTYNTVTVTGGNVVYVIGGQGKTASYNEVTVTGEDAKIEYSGYSTVAWIMGGYSYSTSADDSADGNKVTIENDASFAGYAVYGGYGTSASGNSVTISGTDSVSGIIYGNYATGGAASGSTEDSDGTAAVTIEDAAVAGNIYGGYSSSGGDAADNAVYIVSSDITANDDLGLSGDVYGGYAAGSTYNATGNSVLLGDGENAVTVSGDVYGGYSASGSAAANAVSIYGYVDVEGTIYGGNTSTYTDNSLWVAGIDNYAYTLENFDTITFDISDRSNYETMLTLEIDSSVDLTGVSTITVDEDNTDIATQPGEYLTLIATTGGIVVDSDDIDFENSALDYELDNTTSYVADDSYLTGYRTREITVTDSDGEIVEADDDGYLNGYNLVLIVGDTVTVETVFFDLGEDATAEDSDSSDSEASTAYYYEWGTSRINLEEGVKYDFSADPIITGLNSEITLTDDDDENTFTGTLIYDSETSVLMDGSDANLVMDLDTVDLSDYQGDNAVTITYVPATGMTVEGSASLITVDSDSDDIVESLALQSTSIDAITFTDVPYSSDALTTLASGYTYDMSETTIDVSAFTLVDSINSAITITYDDEELKTGAKIVMTLIDANGGVTNLGSNQSLPTSAENNSLGYKLEGSDGENDTDATLTGTLQGYVDASAEDDDTDGTYADLIMQTGITVTVDAVDLAYAAASDGGEVSIEWDDTTRLVLNSVLEYDFNQAELEDVSDLTITGNAVENTMLYNGASTLLIDANDAAVTSVTDGTDSSMTVVSEQLTTAYTYAPASGVTVTGSASGAADGDDLVLSIDTIGTVTFGDIEFNSEEAPVILSSGYTYDMSETTIDVSEFTLVDSESSRITITYDDEELKTGAKIVMTLIDANGGVTNLGSNQSLPTSAENNSLGYKLEGSDGENDTDATLTGTLQGYVDASAEDDDTDGTYADLIMQTGITVTVDAVDLAYAAASDSDEVSIEWDDTTRLVLNSVLEYDFNQAVLEDVSDLTITGEAVENKMLYNGASTLLIDANGAAVTSVTDGTDSSMTVVSDQLTTAYTYAPASGVTVTGSASGAADGDDLVLSIDTIGTVTFGDIEYDSAEAPVILSSGYTYDMSETTIDVSALNLVDTGGETVDISYEDDGSMESGQIVMTLIDAAGGVTNLDENSGLPAEGEDANNQTFGYTLTGKDDAYLEGTLAGYVSADADDSGLDGSYDLVLRADTEVTVGDVDLDVSDSIEWDNTTRITLNSALSYDFSESTLVDFPDELTITGDAISGTMLANDETTVLIDANGAATSDMSVLAEQISTAYTYAPASGVTVTGSASGAADGDDLALSIDTIESVTFGDIEYDSAEAPVILSSGYTYDMSETTIDVSALNLVDTGGETVDISYEDDGSMESGQIVMTLIDAAGGVTNLDENSGLPAEGDDANNQVFGYTLTGTDDAYLEGTLAGYVTYDEDDSEVSGSYDLVLKADTAVAVGDVDLDVSDSIEWDNTTRITLNSALSYDFSESTLVDFPDELTITGDAISGTMLANGEATVLIDDNGAATSDMSVLADQLTTTYTYTPATGVTVTGSAVGVEGSLELEIEDVGEVTFASIVYDEDEAPVVLKDDIEDDESYDLSETVINVDDLALIDSDGNTVEITYDDSVITEEDGHEVMTLIYANGMSSGLLENDTLPKDTSLTFGYELSDTATGSDSTLSGTLASVVAARSDDSLILKTGTEVSVSDVTLDIETLDWDSDALLTLNSVLSYDFDPVESVSVSEETAIDTDSFLDVGSLKTLIDGESAVAVNGMSNLEGYESSYSYSLLGGVVQVTGTGSTSVSDSGNSLNYAVGNIATMDFYIDEDTPTDEPILEVESADLSGTEVTAHAEGGSYLEPGYEVTLLSTDEGGLTTDGDTTYASVIEGVSIEYELEVGREDDSIVAKVEGGSSLRDETASLPETRLAQTAIIDQGADALIYAFDDALRVAREKTDWTPFIAMSAGDFNYHHSSLEIDSFTGTVGFLRNVFDDKGIFSYGPLFQYGKADYDTHVNGVYADGDVEHVGGGLFFRRRWYDDDWCLEGAITGGYSQADYDSDTLLAGTHSSYAVGSKYLSTYVGLLKEYELSHDRMLQLYTRYFYSHLYSSDAYLSSGEKYYFDDVDSSRLRFGAKFFWNMNKEDYRYHTYVGAAYQYQFQGHAVGVYNGLSTWTQSLRGGSGIIEGGIIYNPKDSDMTMNIGVAGWFGAQEGIEGRLLLKWDL